MISHGFKMVKPGRIVSSSSSGGALSVTPSQAALALRATANIFVIDTQPRKNKQICMVDYVEVVQREKENVTS